MKGQTIYNKKVSGEEQFQEQFFFALSNLTSERLWQQRTAIYRFHLLFSCFVQ